MIRLMGAAIGSVVLLSACATPKPPPERALYDFSPVAQMPARGPWLAVTVSLPAWLDGLDIAYRLNYDDASRLRHFAGSRWAARPAQLISARFAARFAGGKARCTVQVELEEFAQHFASASASSFEIAGRWQIAGPGGERLAGATIGLSEAAGADAPTGVKAAARLADRLGAEISAAAGKLPACGT